MHDSRSPVCQAGLPSDPALGFAQRQDVHAKSRGLSELGVGIQIGVDA